MTRVLHDCAALPEVVSIPAGLFVMGSDRAERFGREMDRDYLADQHRGFYGQLPFL